MMEYWEEIIDIYPYIRFKYSKYLRIIVGSHHDSYYATNKNMNPRTLYITISSSISSTIFSLMLLLVPVSLNYHSLNGKIFNLHGCNFMRSPTFSRSWVKRHIQAVVGRYNKLLPPCIIMGGMVNTCKNGLHNVYLGDILTNAREMWEGLHC